MYVDAPLQLLLHKVPHESLLSCTYTRTGAAVHVRRGQILHRLNMNVLEPAALKEVGAEDTPRDDDICVSSLPYLIAH